MAWGREAFGDKDEAFGEVDFGEEAISVIAIPCMPFNRPINSCDNVLVPIPSVYRERVHPRNYLVGYVFCVLPVVRPPA